jgi:hypothetical protein
LSPAAGTYRSQEGQEDQNMPWLRSLLAAGPLFAAALAASVLCVPTARAQSFEVIYRISGVTDSGSGAQSGNATTFICSNYNNKNDSFRIRLYDWSGSIVADSTFDLPPNRTLNISTHSTTAFFDDAVLSPGQTIAHGLAVITATTTKMICSAMVVNAEAQAPVGIALHMVRYNAAPQSME